jgi:chemotaxis signal transduction protein
VVALGAEQVAPPPPLFRGLPAEYLRGLVRRDGRMVIYLEVQRLLTSTEALQLAQAMETRDG